MGGATDHPKGSSLTRYTDEGLGSVYGRSLRDLPTSRPSLGRVSNTTGSSNPKSQKEAWGNYLWDSKTLSESAPGTGSRKASAYQGGEDSTAAGAEFELPGNDIPAQVDTTYSEENTISSTVAYTENRIWGIDDASRMLITNGTPERLEHIKNPNAIGKVIQDGTLQELYQITPLIMVISQNSRNVQEKVKALLKAGADPDREIVYYNGVTTTPRKLAANYPKSWSGTQIRVTSRDGKTIQFP